ncbi:acyltransferase [uncultured Aquabacterium sp.]|uniref:acyltransferase n=1 Tax=Aquabacterium sp. TaxID=1872578 RepID=UPI0025DD1C8C|nr:acyltransferase [uncultured Aquabacterium sp.]
MKHRILHSHNLRARLPDYAARLGVDVPELTAAYDRGLQHDVFFESQGKGPDDIVTHVSCLDIRKRIDDPLVRQLFVTLYDEIPGRKLPDYGKNWPTLVDRMRRIWEQVYNILINKIPSHNIRLVWLRLGGAKIGKGSTIWRNTEVIGIESLTIGDDSCIGWHCQIDARSGLVIGNHVTIASHVLIVAGGHDLEAPEFWSVSAPVRIDDWAWITSRAIILPGAHIGEGAVVSANTTVGKKVEPYAIVAGQGGKTVGQRVRGLNYKVGGKSLFTLLH